MSQRSEHEPEVMKKNRRKFLQLATLGGGVSLLSAASWLPEARAATTTDALLLSCMDFRLVDDIERYMSGRGLRDKYDHVVLTGASLGAITDKYPAWNKTFVRTSRYRDQASQYSQSHCHGPPRLRSL